MNFDLFADDLSSKDGYSFDNSGEGFEFIDLFAGIGGFHLALAGLGATCVFASEKDNYSRKTYEHNFDTKNIIFNDDIRNISLGDVPDHDVLCAGFPCQPFSQAGLKKGFADGYDSERGNLFYCILDILESKRPNAFILENVRGLIKHDNGNTFAEIMNLLKGAGYTVYYQVLKASDYNIPQLRPRVFIVGFKNADNLPPFEFPQKLPLTYTMSDIFNAKCERDVGFTLRVGGKGSNIDDRRNWEFYRVEGEVRRIGIKEMKLMMSFPLNFELPVSKTQAMKQLGNSVCVEVVRHVSNAVFKYLKEHSTNFEKENNMVMKRNKGELSEVYALCKIIYERAISYGDLKARCTDDTVQVIKIHFDHADINLSNPEIILQNIDTDGNEIDNLNLGNFITSQELEDIVIAIKEGSKTFSNETLDNKVTQLGMLKSKGNSYEKADILLSFLDDDLVFSKQGTSIKSFLGSSPTLLNASQATNFIYEVTGISSKDVESINDIEGNSKIKDRVNRILELGGQLKFLECENSVYESTLRKVDSNMPSILADALMLYFRKEIKNRLSNYPEYKFSNTNQKDEVTCRLKDFVKATMLGIFPTKKWDGNITANSVVLVNNEGGLVFYHTNKDSVLKDFFYQQTYFDTPSSGRHRFGSIYKESNGKYYFKLNLQLRLCDKIM